MLKRLIVLIFLGVVAMVAAPARAQGVVQECDSSSAVAVSFADATGSVALGTCVRIDGVAVGRVLVEDSRARYRAEQRRGDPSSTGAILGLYGETAFDEPTRVRLIGRVSDCAAAEARARQDADANSIVMMIGYCHYFSGRMIMASSIENMGPATFVRQLRSAEEPALGNLSPLADGDVRRQMLAAGERLLRAIRTGDRAALLAMHGGGPDGRRVSTTDVGQLMLDAADSPFAALRDADAVAIEIFGWKPPLWADDAWHAERARTGTAEAIICFSTRADAAAVWPIDSKDADNRPGRPYACSRALIAGTGADAPASFDTEQAATGLAEPD